MDKLQHYIAGVWIGSVVLAIFNWKEWNLFLGVGLIGVGLVAYEFYQQAFKKGVFDWWDAGVGFLGVLNVLFLILAILS